MIKANELRIGNWVGGTSNTEKYPMLLKVVGIAEQVQLLAAENKSGESITFDWEYGLIHPIQLSPELLEKCGFVKEGKYKYVKDDLKFWVYVWTSDSITAETGDCDLGQLASLHQLQNLYFCLCGEELEVKM